MGLLEERLYTQRRRSDKKPCRIILMFGKTLQSVLKRLEELVGGGHVVSPRRKHEQVDEEVGAQNKL